MFSKLRQAISIEHIILISSATYLYRNSFGLEVFSLGFRFPLQRSLIVFSRFIGLLWVKRKREKCIYVIPFFTDIDCSVVIKLDFKTPFLWTEIETVGSCFIRERRIK